jgi:hypothetical protein
MNLVMIGRFVAAGLSLGTFVFLFLHDSWRTDNLFLAPDLVLCAALAAGALLPNRLARRWLPIAFAFTAGVLACSIASYAVRGEVGVASILGALTSVALTVLTTRANVSEAACRERSSRSVASR